MKWLLLSAGIAVAIAAASGIYAFRRKLISGGVSHKILFAFLTIFLFVFSWMLADRLPRPVENVVVTAMGTANEKSKGSTVVLQDVSIEGRDVEFTWESEKPWSFKSAAYTWKQYTGDDAEKTPAVDFTIHVPVGTERQLKFQTGKDRGFVMVDTGDYQTYSDCYASKAGTLKIALPDSSTQLLKQWHIRRLIYFCALELLGMAFILFSARRIRKAENAPATGVKPRRNQALEFYRMVFCFAVIMRHSRGLGTSNAFSGGYLPVDFFFIISGYFLMQFFEKYGKNGSVSAKQYLWSRVRKIYPAFFVALVLSIIMTYITSKEAPLVQNWWYEFLVLDSFGFKIKILSVAWYIGAMLVASLFLYFLLERWY